MARAAFPGLRNTPPAKVHRCCTVSNSGAERGAGFPLISEEHGSPGRRRRRTQARHRERRVRLQPPRKSLMGEYSRNVGPNIDAWSDFQPIGVVAGHLFNFPGDGAAVDRTCWPSFAATPSSSLRARPQLHPADRRAVPRSRPAEGRAEHGARRQGKPWTARSRAPGESHQLRRPPPPNTSMPRAPSVAARAGPGRRGRTMRCRCPTPTCNARRVDGCRLRLLRRALHGDLGGGGVSATRWLSADRQLVPQTRR